MDKNGGLKLQYYFYLILAISFQYLVQIFVLKSECRRAATSTTSKTKPKRYYQQEPE